MKRVLTMILPFMPYLLVGVVVLVFAKKIKAFFANILPNPSNDEEQKKQDEAMKAALEALSKTTSNACELSSGEHAIIARNLQNALLDGYFSEDEDAVKSNIKRIPSLADWNAVQAEFGTKKAWPWGQSYTLTTALIEFIHGNDLKEIKDYLKTIKVTL